MHQFIHTRTCESGSYFSSAMTRISWERTTRASLPSIPSTERTNNEKCFRWSLQCVPCLSLLIFTNLAMSDLIGSYLYVSASASPSLTSMMASNWRYHKTRIITYPLPSLYFSLPWHISFSYLVHSWCIRGSARTYAEVKAYLFIHIFIFILFIYVFIYLFIHWIIELFYWIFYFYFLN